MGRGFADRLWIRLAVRRNDQASLERLAGFILRHAEELIEQGATCAIDGVKFVGFEAARARASRLVQLLAASSVLEDRDRQELLDFVRLLELPQRKGAGRLRRGVPSLRGFLREREYSKSAYDAFKTNYLRFIAHLRAQRGRPATLRTLPIPFIVDWMREQARRGRLLSSRHVLVAAGLLLLLLLRPHRRPAATFESATATIVGDLGGGARMIQGDDSGRWWILRPSGAMEYAAPDALALPHRMRGGTTGDLTGDGRAEIVLYGGDPFDGPEPAFVSIFTSDGSRWRRLAQFAAAPGDGSERDQCQWALDEMRRPERTLVSEELRRVRQGCPHAVTGAVVTDSTLHLVQTFYGRQRLVVHCRPEGCTPPKRALSYDSDATSMVVVGHGAGRRLIVGTGCWKDVQSGGGGSYAYGVLAERLAGDSGRVMQFLPLEGVSAVVAVGDNRVAVVTGTACEGDDPARAMLASTAPTPAAWRSTLRILDVGSDEALSVREAASLNWLCPPGADSGSPSAACGEGARVVVLHDGQGRPAFLVLSYSLYRGTPGQYVPTLTAYDLARELGSQSPAFVELGAGDGSTVAAVDLDGDGEEEVVVSGSEQGTHAMCVQRTANVPRLVECRP